MPSPIACRCGAPRITTTGGLDGLRYMKGSFQTRRSQKMQLTSAPRRTGILEDRMLHGRITERSETFPVPTDRALPADFGTCNRRTLAVDQYSLPDRLAGRKNGKISADGYPALYRATIRRSLRAPFQVGQGPYIVLYPAMPRRRSERKCRRLWDEPPSPLPGWENRPRSPSCP